MKTSELTQIKGLTLKELKVKLKSITGEIANLVLDKNMKKVKDVKIISKKRKDLAQILTIMRQKQLLSELEFRVESQEFSDEDKVKNQKSKVKTTSKNSKVKIEKEKK